MGVATDSSAAKSTASRSGIGKVRHLDTWKLRVQEAVRLGCFALEKVCGDTHPANHFTKPLSHVAFINDLQSLGAELKHRSP